MGNNDAILQALRKRERELREELARVKGAIRSLAGKPMKNVGRLEPKRPALPPSGRRERGTILDRVVAVIEDAGRPVDFDDLVKQVSVSKATLSATLSRGKEKERVVNVDRGRWATPSLAEKRAPEASGPRQN